ncbi:MAG: LysM domain-containing protein [Planctomycetota bacterium]
MTREQKLGLIAGFTVVLLFGVLLADHLSRARAEPLLASDPVDEPLVIPALETPSRLGASALPSRPRISVVSPERLVEPSVDPSGVGGAVAGGPAVLGGGRGVAAAEIDTGGLTGGLSSVFEPVLPRSGRSAGGVSGGERVVLPGFVPVSEPGSRSDRTTAARGRTHEVRSGESLFAISARYYGNGHLWRELARHNAGRVGADGGVDVGVVLTIPVRARLDGAVAGAGVGTAAGAVGSGGVGSGGVGSGGVKSYTVRAGDTLSEISQRLLGTTRRMDELIDLNRDLIRDADDIRVGMSLRYRAGPSA